MDPRSWWGYLISVSVVTQVFVLPLVGTIADFSPNKKRLMAVFAYTGALATITMFFLVDGAYLAGGVLFLIANLAFGASIVIYNSFLPDIAPPEERDAVSSKGWGIGYLGGGLLLALNLALFSKSKALGISESLAVRINLASAGLWWALFTVIPLDGPTKSCRRAECAGSAEASRVALVNSWTPCRRCAAILRRCGF